MSPLTAIAIKRIRRARLLDRDGLFRIDISAGRIAAIEAEPEAEAPVAPSGEEIDGGGMVVTGCLVDPHLHLDLAYSQDLVGPNESGTLREAIGLWSIAKATISAEDTRRRAEKAIRAEVGFGTGLIRSHVDVASNAGLRLTEGVLAAREATRALCEIDLVAFPQDGLTRDPGALENCGAAIDAGVDRMGGIPHVEATREDGLRHLDAVFDLAMKKDVGIDVHIDETDDPNSRYTEALAAKTIERGYQGRVTASHVCALASYDEAGAQRVMDLIAEARISVVTNPGVNLHLQGRYDRYPKRRGLTRIVDLLARGVRCAAGQDCIRDPFYPFGNGAMLDQAWLLAHAEHMSRPGQIRQAFGMVCEMAAAVVGREHGVEVGKSARLVVHGAGNIQELVRLRPTPRGVLFDGIMTAGASIGGRG
ncbi:MAG: amidohydrolase family protein [Phycisphaerales bacterium]|nr:amidohydrolase family protein [Phycisphaerales bacterium]